MAPNDIVLMQYARVANPVRFVKKLFLNSCLKGNLHVLFKILLVIGSALLQMVTV